MTEWKVINYFTETLPRITTEIGRFSVSLSIEQISI